MINLEIKNNIGDFILRYCLQNAKEELIRWEEGKKWQTKVEGIRNKLKEKEGEVYILTKQLNTLKDLFAK